MYKPSNDLRTISDLSFSFQSILGQLLNADKTYMKMAKDLIANDYPGPVVELLGQMIQCQCVNHVHYAFVNPLPLCMLWLECLTATAAWHRDTNAVYLVDVVLRVAWQMPDMWSVVKEFFRYNCTKNGGVTSSTASFLPALLSGLGSGAGAMLAMLPAVTPNTMWMALLTLELEHEMLERQSGVWSELLRQLRAVPASTRFSLDGVLKASAAAVQCTHAPTAATLVLYKYVQLMLASRSDHELLPIVAQRFFQLYLARVPLVDDEQRHASVFGVADKFYEHNVGLMKRLKRHLAQAEADRKSAGLTCDDEAMAAFQTSCSRIFGTYGLWLEETRLNELASGCSAQQFGEFPPQYETQRLRRIFAGDEVSVTVYYTVSFGVNIYAPFSPVVFRYSPTGPTSCTCPAFGINSAPTRNAGNGHASDCRQPPALQRRPVAAKAAPLRAIRPQQQQQQRRRSSSKTSPDC